MNIREIAQRAGVSSATVSRVLNNSGYVKSETRQKVMEVVKAYDYVPNEIARSLSIQDSFSIGVIIPDIENEFFSKVINGVNEVAEKYHYNLIFWGTNETLAKEHRCLDLVKRRWVKGVLIAPISDSDDVTRQQLLALEKSGVPVVLIDRDVKGARFDGVFVDNQQGACDGVTELIRAGHQRIAVITGPDTSKPGKGRYQGYVQAMEENGLAIRPEYVACGDFKIAKAYACTKRLMELPEPPTAIFTSNNLSTLGCLKYLTEKKLKLGRDVSLMGFDDIETLKMIDYRISVVERDAKQQGMEAMKLLEECFESGGQNRQRGKRVTVPYQVILRGSEQLKTVTKNNLT